MKHSKVFNLKEYQVIAEKLPNLTSIFPAFQARTADQEEKNRVSKSSIKTFLQSRIKKIEPHQTIVSRMSLLDREKLQKVDVNQTFSSYDQIDFDMEDIRREKDAARSVVATMDSESARRYDSQLVNKMWSNMLLNIGKVARYYQK